MIEQEFQCMVSKLAKSGVHIAYSLNGLKAHNWHMATGIAGECGELLEFANKLKIEGVLDKDNAIEELGDINFYLTGLVQDNPYLDMPLVENKEEHIGKTIYMLVTEITIAGIGILDAVKKVVIYEKAIESSTLQHSINTMFASMCDLYSLLGITHKQVLEANINKLLHAKNARYASGIYSNEQAQDRADKGGNNERS